MIKIYLNVFIIFLVCIPFLNSKNNEKEWEDEAIEKAEIILEKIKAHPFIEELRLGTLDKNKFLLYITQDIFYNVEFATTFSILSDRVINQTYKEFYDYASDDSIKLAEALRKTYNINETGKEYLPECKEYSDIEREYVTTGYIEEAVAIVVPCYYVYKVISEYLLETAVQEGNQYWKFIQEMGGDNDKVDFVFHIANEYARNNQRLYYRMMVAFLKGVQKEYDFWDAPYRHGK